MRISCNSLGLRIGLLGLCSLAAFAQQLKIIEGGASKRAIWIDQIAAIRDLSPRTWNQFTIQLKDGSSFDARYVCFRCEQQEELKDENMACSSLLIQNPDESTEKIDIAQAQRHRILAPPFRFPR